MFSSIRVLQMEVFDGQSLDSGSHKMNLCDSARATHHERVGLLPKGTMPWARKTQKTVLARTALAILAQGLTSCHWRQHWFLAGRGGFGPREKQRRSAHPHKIPTSARAPEIHETLGKKSKQTVTHLSQCLFNVRQNHARHMYWGRRRTQGGSNRGWGRGPLTMTSAVCQRTLFPFSAKATYPSIDR